MKLLFTKQRCPICGTEEKYIAFNWKMAMEGYKEFKYFVHGLKLKEDLKSGSLYQCLNCSSYWYLEKKGNTMIYVEDMNLIYKWNCKKYHIEDYIYNKLSLIGATPPDLYGNRKDFIEVPCKVRTKENEIIDLSLIRFQSTPPQHTESNIRFIDEIHDVTASEFALPARVRVATSKAPEISMGFAPTKVITPNGERFLLNWSTDFFDYGEYKGKDIELADYTQEYLPPIVNVDPSRLTIFFGDLLEEHKSLWISEKP
jgi:hypothetical protein